MDYIEASNASLQNQVMRLDSLLLEQEKVFRSMRAEQTMNLNQLDRDLKVIVGLLDDSGLMVSKLDQRIENLRREIILPSKDTTLDASDSSSNGSSASVDLKALYDLAYIDQKKGNHKDAIFGFEQFISEASGKAEMEAFLDDALYGIGESYFSMEKYSEALPKYQELLDKYPKSDKYVQAMFKKGIIFQRQNKPDLAEIVFNNIVKDYPQSPESELSKDRLLDLKQNR
jgi:TolA-binding protein